MPHPDLGDCSSRLDPLASTISIGRMKLRIATFICRSAAGMSRHGAGAQASGRVIGRVLDQTGAALPGVAIDLFVNDHES